MLNSSFYKFQFLKQGVSKALPLVNQKQTRKFALRFPVVSFAYSQRIHSAYQQVSQNDHLLEQASAKRQHRS